MHFSRVRRVRLPSFRLNTPPHTPGPRGCVCSLTVFKAVSSTTSGLSRQAGSIHFGVAFIVVVRTAHEREIDESTRLCEFLSVNLTREFVRGTMERKRDGSFMERIRHFVKKRYLLEQHCPSSGRIAIAGRGEKFWKRRASPRAFSSRFTLSPTSASHDSKRQCIIVVAERAPEYPGVNGRRE